MLTAKSRRMSVLALAAACMAPMTALAGPDWVEGPVDAGSNLPSAQMPNGMIGQLNTIRGVLNGGTGLLGDFEDMFIIRIANPATFSCAITTANFNAQLFLFNISLPGGAYGLLSNDDQTGANNFPKFFNTSNDGTGVVVDLAGDYMIGVSGFNNDPSSITGTIFGIELPTEISGPDGPGGFNRHIGWSGNGETGNYLITMTGAEFPTFPVPGTLPILAMGGVVLGRRRRA